MPSGQAAVGTAAVSSLRLLSLGYLIPPAACWVGGLHRAQAPAALAKRCEPTQPFGVSFLDVAAARVYSLGPLPNLFGDPWLA